MQSRKTPTKLELHRLKYHWSGKTCPLISYAELDPGEKRLLSENVFTTIYAERSDDPYSSFARVFSEWGVACPHPQHKRLYLGVTEAFEPLHEPRWYTCSCCHCSVINEDYIRPDGRRKDSK